MVWNMLREAEQSSYSVVPHLQVVQEPGDVQAPFSSIPVVVGPDVFEAGVSKHTVVVLWEEEEQTADQSTVKLTDCDAHHYHPRHC